MSENYENEKSITTLSGVAMRLPANWAVVELGNFIVKGGGTVDPSKHPEEVFDLYSIPSYDTQKPELLKGSEIGSTKKVVQANDVLLSRIVPHIQRSWVVGANCGQRQIGSGEWIIFRGNAFVPKYMRYFLLSYAFHRKLMTTLSGVGGSLTRANPNQVAAFSCPLPPISEQQRIVARTEELFSSLDAGVESLKKAQAQLKTYRQAVLKWAFDGRLTNRDLKAGELPGGWQIEKLGSVTEKPKYGTSKKCGYDVKGVGVLRIPNIGNGFISITDLKYALFEAKELEDLRLKEGDILTIRSNGSVDLVGKCALVTKKEECFLYAGYLIRLRPIFKVVTPKFLLYLMASKEVRAQIESKAKSTSGVNNVNSEELRSLSIPICCLAEQGQIVEEIESRLSVCDKLEESIAQSLKQAEALRQSILKKAFEGKLVPQDPNDELASVLLERIRAERENAGSAVAKSPKTARRKKKQ